MSMVGKGQFSEPIYLRDVGNVSITSKDLSDIITYKGQPAISLTIYAQKGSDIPSLQKNIGMKLDQLFETLPPRIQLQSFYLQSSYVEQTFRNLGWSFAISIVAVVLVMLLGLSFSASLLVTISIPMSVLIGLVPLPYTGVDSQSNLYHRHDHCN